MQFWTNWRSFKQELGLRRRVKKLILYESTQDRYMRVVRVLKSTFGTAVEPLLMEHHDSLNALASRNVYLFEFFGVCLLSINLFLYLYLATQFARQTVQDSKGVICSNSEIHTCTS
jgi:hypothetical protein